jgi:NAD(P)-dependent dehydrogenase (short-subunit alcohol dehydrogenase family)
MSAKKLAGKVAVVTGASKGIGAAIAKHLAAEGAAVVVNYSASKDGAERVVNEVTANGGRAIAVKANLSKKADIDQLFAETKKAFGPIDILVNNAGIYEFSPVEEITEEHYRKQFDLNVLGLALATQAAVKQFSPAGGSVVNISSVVSTLGIPGAAVRSRVRSRRNSGRARFASTPSIPAWSRRKAFTPLAWLKVTCANKSRRKHHWDASDSRRTSRRPRSSLRRRIPRGSPAKH